LEVNASDDRSSDILTDILSRAMGNSTLDANKIPNCVILDEIDGIDNRTSIDALVTIAKRSLKSNNKGGTSTKGHFAMTRPVICICNDHQSPMLKELKDISEVFIFLPPTETRLIQRLKTICLAEALPLTLTSLASLCQASGCDIRSAINILQFASMKLASSSLNSKLNAADCSRTLASIISLELKDSRIDIFRLLRQILSTKEAGIEFDKRTATKKAYDNYKKISIKSNDTINSSASPIVSTHMMDVIESARSYGDNSFVLSGIYENYLQIKYMDSTMQRTALCADWISYTDTINNTMFGGDYNSGYELMQHTTSVFGAVHLLCATDNRITKLSYPSKVNQLICINVV
jgi:chromosome transmission fidelity protein 18